MARGYALRGVRASVFLAIAFLEDVFFAAVVLFEDVFFTGALAAAFSAGISRT